MTIKKNILKKMCQIVGKENCSCEKEDIACYSYDSTAKVYYPDAIVFPDNSNEISEILKLANIEKVPVVPRGSGSGTTGGSLPVKGGIVVVMTRMNRIKKIDTDNLIAFVEPGVITGKFQEIVEKEGLLYPPDPSSAEFSTLGGNLAECAGGPKAVKYGVTRDYVLGIEVVLPTGEIINTGVQTAKGVVGYDLTRLFVGSEGTLGIITQMTLKLIPLPQAVRTMTAVFSKIDAAAETISEIIRKALIPRTIEFLDNASIRCAEDFIKIGLPKEAQAMLIIEVDGKETDVDKDIKILGDVCIKNGAEKVEFAKTKDEVDLLWKARKSIPPALFQYGPDKINEDIVVPRSKIPQMVKKIDELREETGLTMVSFGHAGDGNIHFNIILDKKNKKDLLKAEKVIGIIFDYTIELGGTISGEHGVGITKSQYITKEIEDPVLHLMKNIKKLFDPNNILNPGKIF